MRFFFSFIFRMFQRPEFYLILIVLFLLKQEGRAEEALDSADKLYSAQYATSKRTENGFFNDALLAAKDALKTAENRFGSTHPSVVPVLTDLASLYRIMGRYGEAESSLKWGLAVREKALGPNHPLVAETLDHLASLYNDWGRWDEAEFYGKRALSLRDEKGGQTELIQALTLLGEVNLSLQKFPEAQNLLRRSLTLQEKKEGGAAQTILLLNSLSQAYLGGKRLPEAESCLQKALALTRKNFSGENIEVADATKKLADFYFVTGRLDKSKPLFEAALKIYKGYVGVYFGYMALPYLQRLAEAYQSAGDYLSAKDLLEKTLATSRESFGSQHPLVAVTLLRLAHAEAALGEKKNAKNHQEESLHILETLFPKDHPLLQRVLAQEKK